MDIQISELIETTVQLAPKDFEQFIHEVYNKRAKYRAPSLSDEETVLLNKIYSKLPEETQGRFEHLKNKFSSNSLTEVEYAEYLGLIEIKENHNAECVENIIKLAQLQSIHPKELMQKLGIFPLYKL